MILRFVLGFMGQNRGVSLLQDGGCIIWGLDQVRPSNKDEVCSESGKVRETLRGNRYKNTRIWENLE